MGIPLQVNTGRQDRKTREDKTRQGKTKQKKTRLKTRQEKRRSRHGKVRQGRQGKTGQGKTGQNITRQEKKRQGKTKTKQDNITYCKTRQTKRQKQNNQILLALLQLLSGKKHYLFSPALLQLLQRMMAQSFRFSQWLTDGPGWGESTIHFIGVDLDQTPKPTQKPSQKSCQIGSLPEVVLISAPPPRKYYVKNRMSRTGSGLNCFLITTYRFAIKTTFFSC